MAGKDNLDPVRDTETAKARGKRGGINSGIAKRRKKLLSEIYSELLAEDYGVNNINFKQVVKDILSRRDAPAVSMLKEVREATEGNKLTVDANITVDIDAKKQELKDRLTRLATDRTTTT